MTTPNRLRHAIARAALAMLGAVFARPDMADAAGPDIVRHGLAMHGEPALAAGFTHLPYVDPRAPKGGRLTIGLQGTFDGINPLIVKGVAPDAVPKYVLQSLMARSLDEPFTLYGLVARAVEMPEDRSRVAFDLDPRARFSDGTPLTSADVRFSFETLRAKGRPFYRAAFSRVRAVETQGSHRIAFDLAGADDRELPLLIAQMPIFARHATDAERFDETTLKPILGSGPYVVAEVKPGESILLRRDPDFWAADHAMTRGLFNADEIRYDFYRDANTLFEAFKAGLIDFRVESDPGRWTSGYDTPAVRDGRILIETVPFGLPRGMNGFAFNTRRAALADIRVREAIAGLFDFEWINRVLYAGAYRRTTSFFEGSELASSGRPASARERALLAPFPGAVRPDILEGGWRPAPSDGGGRDREAARRALALFAEAGYALKDGAMRDKTSGAPFVFEFMVSNTQQERLALNFAATLARIGVTARVRQVDNVQYWRRMAAFDFDMAQFTWATSLSPGNEQFNRWGAAAAGREGSLNYPGVASPAVDAMITAMLTATTRAEFVDATRALDRVLLSGFYVTPLFNAPDQWLARWRHVGRPARAPLTGVAPETFWRNPS